jgi:hypothetical protein
MNTDTDKYMCAVNCIDNPLFIGTFSECYAWMRAYNVIHADKVRVYILLNEE